MIYIQRLSAPKAHLYLPSDLDLRARSFDMVLLKTFQHEQEVFCPSRTRQIDCSKVACGWRRLNTCTNPCPAADLSQSLPGSILWMALH